MNLHLNMFTFCLVKSPAFINLTFICPYLFLPLFYTSMVNCMVSSSRYLNWSTNASPKLISLCLPAMDLGDAFRHLKNKEVTCSALLKHPGRYAGLGCAG